MHLILCSAPNTPLYICRKSPGAYTPTTYTQTQQPHNKKKKNYIERERKNLYVINSVSTSKCTVAAFYIYQHNTQTHTHQ